MSEKSFFSSICSLFKSIFSSGSQQQVPSLSVPTTSEPQAPLAMTGVARYLENLSSKVTTTTSVERYIQNKLTSAQSVTGVERYIQNKTKLAVAVTGVERYILNQG
jgi:hypothetical protein|tara:strand:- start:570 stop:887 length:318 start_codon:yes stop_codon:yes gene_type:complete